MSQTLAKHLRSNSKVVLFVGAGISTAAGIPDFRSPDTGLYANLERLNLPYAEAVFDIDFFRNDPVPFYTLAKELYPGQFVPTQFHELIALLDKKGLLHRVYTQNIDTLERIAGVGSDKIVEAHGSFDDHRCIKCHRKYDGAKFKEKLMKDQVINCECGGYVKPSIVFFGEGLPERFFQSWEDDTELFGCHRHAGSDDEDEEVVPYVAIIAGTSLKVHPFASLPEELPGWMPRVLVNMELVGSFDMPRENDEIVLGSTEEFAQALMREMEWDVVRDGGEVKETDVENKVEEITRKVEEATTMDDAEPNADLQDSTVAKDVQDRHQAKVADKSEDIIDSNGKELKETAEKLAELSI